MSKKIPQPNTTYETERGLPVLCMSAHQWVFEKRSNEGYLQGYTILITTNPLKVSDGKLERKNAGGICEQFISNEKVSLGSRGHGATIEDFQKIHKMFQEAK